MQDVKDIRKHDGLYHIDITNISTAGADVSKKVAEYLPENSDISFKIVFVGSVGKSFTVDITTPVSDEISTKYGITRDSHRFFAKDSMGDGWTWQFDDEQDIRYLGQVHPVLIEILNKYMFLVMDIVENNDIIEAYHCSSCRFDFTIKANSDVVSIEHQVDEHIARFSIKNGECNSLVCVEWVDDGTIDSQLELPSVKNSLLLNTLKPMARQYGM